MKTVKKRKRRNKRNQKETKNERQERPKKKKAEINCRKIPEEQLKQMDEKDMKISGNERKTNRKNKNDLDENKVKSC